MTKVEFIEGLQAAAGATALALIWEDRIVIDAKVLKKPAWIPVILRHEMKHLGYVRKYGMTSKAGWRNYLLDASYRFTLCIPLRIAYLIERRRMKKRGPLL